MRTLLLLGASAALALAGCAAREPAVDPDPVAATPGGPSTTGTGEEDRPLPTPAPGEMTPDQQQPTKQPPPTPGAR